MGDQQSRQAGAATGGEEGAAAGEGAAQTNGGVVTAQPEAEAPRADAPPHADAPPQAAAEEPTAEPPSRADGSTEESRDGAPLATEASGTAAAPGSGSGIAAPTTGSLPTEGDVLVRLLTSLGSCPGNTMALSEILERLPDSLRQLAADRETICNWLRGFPALLEVTGAPGQEQVTLTVGRLPRLAAGGAAAASPPPAAVPAAAEPPAPTAAAAATAAASAPAKAAEPMPGASGAVSNTGLPGEENEAFNPGTVQLRGLPFRATISDIKAFLGEHAANLTKSEPPIRLLLNRDGRPSGFARVQFTSPEAAEACREALHRRPMGDRYVEVMACADRSGRMRNRRVVESAPDGGAGPTAPTDPTAEYMERERVLAECREHMRMPGQNQLLLSMLGIALSPPARAYLRRANLGLKHFLARLPNEFRVEGPKGCEQVIWCGAGASVPQNQVAAFSPEAWNMNSMSMPMPEEPGTPKVAASPNIALAGSGHFATPSDWGTPNPWLTAANMPTDSNGQCVGGMDFSSGWNPNWAGAAGWGNSWIPPWPHGDGSTGDVNLGAMAPGGAKPPAPEAPAAAAKSKRGGRGDSATTRSHAHLHPQSHPFANRPATAGEAVAPGNTSEGDSTTAAVLRLRGLPFSVTVQDVLAFFAQHDVADRIADGPQAAQLLPKANGRPSGQAVVQMRSRADAVAAQRALFHQYIGGRYIEVFAYGGEGELGKEETQLPSDAQRAPAPAPSPPPPGAGLPGGDPAAEWMQGMGGHPWQSLPWANLVAPPPVAPGVAVEAGGQDDMWASIFGNLFRGDGAAGAAGLPTAASTLPASAPSRPTLQV
mmetsp:Transcript_21429/g.61710  ORF Transcript_21429/g.61710 Transcript_21429/m.61710 type:complete len:825 (-) Transcript_21429:131-2605(-)